jgi:tRNA(fMet)-specific endonuclease VapC
MTLLYLLDTNTILEPIKPEPDKKVVSLIDNNYDRIAISSFVVYELIKGVYQLSPSRKRQRIFDYIEDVLSTCPY